MSKVIFCSNWVTISSFLILTIICIVFQCMYKHMYMDAVFSGHFYRPASNKPHRQWRTSLPASLSFPYSINFHKIDLEQKFIELWPLFHGYGPKKHIRCWRISKDILEWTKIYRFWHFLFIPLKNCHKMLYAAENIALSHSLSTV